MTPPLPPMNNPASFPQHWTAFRLGRLGDVVLCTGVLDYFSRHFGWTFTVVVKAAFAPVFEQAPYIDKIVCPTQSELSGLHWPQFCRSLADHEQGSMLLDLHGTTRSRVLSFFWRGPVLRYPKMSLKRRIFLLSSKRAFSASLRCHTVPQRYYMAVNSPPPPPHELLPVIYLTEEEKAAAQARITALYGQGIRPVALHPFAAHPLKSWSPKRWQELAALLDSKKIAWIALGSDPLPSPFVGNKRDLCNSTSLRESCALLSCCAALISGDSGPMHLATGVGTPVVALFGPTTREWGFYPSGARDVVCEQNLPCRPCSLHGKAACPYAGRCLDGLLPQVIFEKHIQPLLCD